MNKLSDEKKDLLMEATVQAVRDLLRLALCSDLARDGRRERLTRDLEQIDIRLAGE